MRDESRNYIVVGTFVIGMVVALVVWIMLVSGRTGASDDYHMFFTNVQGLKSGVEILFEGYPVGLIEGIEPVRRDGGTRFRVDVSVRRGWRVPEDSTAAVTQGLFSASLINISAGESQQSLASGSEIHTDESGGAFAAVQEAAPELAETLESIRPTLAERFPEIANNISEITGKPVTTIDQLNVMLGQSNVDRVGRILANMEVGTSEMNEVVRELGTTRSNLDGVIVKVDGLLEKDQGDVSMALADLRYSLATLSRHIDAIGANLETSTRNMNEFTRQLRDTPGVLLRGRASDDGS